MEETEAGRGKAASRAGKGRREEEEGGRDEETARSGSGSGRCFGSDGGAKTPILLPNPGCRFTTIRGAWPFDCGRPGLRAIQRYRNVEKFGEGKNTVASVERLGDRAGPRENRRKASCSGQIVLEAPTKTAGSPTVAECEQWCCGCSVCGCTWCSTRGDIPHSKRGKWRTSWSSLRYVCERKGSTPIQGPARQEEEGRWSEEVYHSIHLWAEAATSFQTASTQREKIP
mmetsp:Transcript_19968/g.40347  ORF Transcript_19968/g.40347 Transcript_19968/m.40347 type:complete len:228 (+) Transcript_19968:3736-4419(+)